MLRRAAVGGVWLSVVAGAAVVPSAQDAQTPPVFRGGVDVVQIDVTVLDGDRQPVRGLTAADFTVLERGEPQPIVSFGAIDLPPRPVDRAPWVRDVAPDVATNSQNAQRVVVIFMDDFGTPFDPGVSKRAKTIAHAVIDALGPSDLAAVIYSLGRRQGQEFTVDRARLRAAVDRFTPSGLIPPSGGNPFSAARNPLVVPIREQSGACGSMRCIQDAMRNAATVLTAYPGSRKTLVYISPFTPVFRADSIETTGALSDWVIVLRDMQAANLAVYQFDPRGLEVGVDITADLGMFADATGGRTYKNTNAPEAGVPQMFRENSSYYMLGIQPANLVRNGRFRPIEVRVNRPGLTVRTRSGYFAPRDELPNRRNDRPERTAAERAIEGALPSGELAMSLAASPRPGSSSRAHTVDVLAGFVPLGLAPEGEDVQVLVTAFRDDWREVARATQSVRVTPRGAVGPPRVDVPIEFSLPPGRYEVRTAMTRARTGETGSAYASLTVPDFDRELLSMSGVVIERAAGPGAESDTASFTATTVRQFLQTDRVRAALSVQQGGRQAPGPVTVTFAVIDDLGRTRASRRVALAAGAFGEGRSAGLRLDVPLGELEPGEYLASFEASSARGIVQRFVRLVVR